MIKLRKNQQIYKGALSCDFHRLETFYWSSKWRMRTIATRAFYFFFPMTQMLCVEFFYIKTIYFCYLQQSAYQEGTSSSEGTLNGELPNIPSSGDVENKISFSRQTQQEFIMEHESSALDKWSRWIFPPTFLVLNLFYWVYYLVIDKSNIPKEQ